MKGKKGECHDKTQILVSKYYSPVNGPVLREMAGSRGGTERKYMMGFELNDLWEHIKKTQKPT